MQRNSLTNLAFILVFIIFFFVYLTHRMLSSTDLNDKSSPFKTLSDFKSYNSSLPHIVTFEPKKVSIGHSTAKATSPPTNSETTDTANYKQNRQEIFIKNESTTEITKPEAPSIIKNVQLHEIVEHVSHHEYESPRNGTDISLPNQASLLQCKNQAKCVVPELQLQKKFKIYLCRNPTRTGLRFYYMNREGLSLHPNVELLTQENMHQADYYFYLPGSAPWVQSECNSSALASKLIVLDESDGLSLLSHAVRNKSEPHKVLIEPVWYNMYFKRSFVKKTNGQFIGYTHLHRPQDVFPLTYAIAETYIPHRFNEEREIEVSCTLRGTVEMTTRQRAQDWTAEYGRSRGVKNIISGQVDTLERKNISTLYFSQMHHTQIIVTVNPASWEGDFRLWESLSSGALIFVDPIFVPHPYPLVDGEHVVFYANNNKTDLFSKLDFYRNNPDIARKIARNGYLHSMKYHRTVNLMDYILRTIHVKESMANHLPVPKYRYTGQYLNFEASSQESLIKACHTPGIYEDITLAQPAQQTQSSSDGSSRNSSEIVPISKKRISCSPAEQQQYAQWQIIDGGGDNSTNTKFTTGVVSGAWKPPVPTKHPSSNIMFSD